MITHLIKERSRARRRLNNETATIGFLRKMVIAGGNDMERFHAMFFDARGTYLGDDALGQGRAGGLTVRQRELFEGALAFGASGIVIAHNHPSGVCRPSSQDIEATRRLSTVAQALDIQLLDHLIFTAHSVYSMRAGGNL